MSSTPMTAVNSAQNAAPTIKISQHLNIEGRMTEFGLAMLKDRYLLPNEEVDDLFKRVCSAYSDNIGHQQRLYEYISKLWFMPATPVLSNGGSERGLPISCFLNECSDSLTGINNLWSENVALASLGGGIGSYWGSVRSIGEPAGKSGQTSGIMPFIKVMDSMTLAISQGSLRRGSAATYLPIDHPEIEEFMEMRKPTGGDPNRRALNLHHGVCITDKFMHAVENNSEWDLISPYNKKVINTVKARDLWVKLLTMRIETGEPYILFIDRVNELKPDIQKKLGLEIKTSNLCTEITLPTGIDHLGNDRTAVCCLSSLNLEYYDEWKTNDKIIPDILRFLDNVLQDFINRAPDSMAKAKYSAMRERSVGLGVMGLHSYFQSKMVPFESVAAKSLNKEIFKHIKQESDKASVEIAKEKGACPDAIDAGIMERFSNKISIAPTASISVICGESSPGIEPYSGNVYVQKTLTGSFVVKNKHLQILLASKGHDTDKMWADISSHEGSVQHLDILDEYEKKVFKTAHELNQMWLIDLSADRTPFVCQAQSFNLFLNADIDKETLHKLHYMGWKKGLKSFYYARAKSLGRADKVSHEAKVSFATVSQNDGNYEECIACQ